MVKLRESESGRIFIKARGIVEGKRNLFIRDL